MQEQDARGAHHRALGAAVCRSRRAQNTGPPRAPPFWEEDAHRRSRTCPPQTLTGQAHTHARTQTRTHARTHANTHARTHAPLRHAIRTPPPPPPPPPLTHDPRTRAHSTRMRGGYLHPLHLARQGPAGYMHAKAAPSPRACFRRSCRGGTCWRQAHQPKLGVRGGGGGGERHLMGFPHCPCPRSASPFR